MPSARWLCHGPSIYQERETATKAARVFIDNGNLDAARRLYKQRRDLGLKEPDISPGRKDLWDYRWEHAEARLSARRGNRAEADKHVAAATAILDDLKKLSEAVRLGEEFLALSDRLRRTICR
jgi:hypothetical protein